MQITDLDFPTSKTENGLKEIKLTGLGRLVLLAGSNGSGKTRLLQSIETIFRQRPSDNSIFDAKEQLFHLQKKIKTASAEIANIERSHHGLEWPVGTKQSYDSLKTAVANWKLTESNHRKLLAWDFVRTDKKAEVYVAISAMPNTPRLFDDRNETLLVGQQQAEMLADPGRGDFAKGTLAYIRSVSDLYFNTSHQESDADADTKDIAKQNYDKLKELVATFLGCELRRMPNGDPSLFGMRIAEARLSQGQNILLQICVQIHAQSAKLDDVVLLLDEPENHLHPAACIELVRSISNAAPSSQIWIATHSLPILANFCDEATLVFVDDGQVSFSGNVPEKVLKTLVGDEKVISKIRDFTSLPSVYALNRYTAECLLPPAVVGGKERDVQTAQIQKQIEILSTQSETLRVLDWGAGKGRILDNLANETDNLSEIIDYWAYDPYPDDKDLCMSVIANVFGEGLGRHFANEEQIKSTLTAHSVDVVIMCNVLHEIDPADWCRLFGSEGPISRLLSDEGFLLVVEDEEIPFGERAHKYGFIVLGTNELRELFQVTEADKGFLASDQRGDGRLKAHLIPKRCLARISSKTRANALKAKQVNSSERIKTLRKASPDYRAGRKLAFWLQQYANSALALEQFTAD